VHPWFFQCIPVTFQEKKRLLFRAAVTQPARLKAWDGFSHRASSPRATVKPLLRTEVDLLNDCVEVYAAFQKADNKRTSPTP
jgi:hypothetical protein